MFGSDLTAASPRAGRVVDALRRLDLLVVADSFRSGTAALADVVLPVGQWPEEDGTVTNLEGRVIRRRRAVDHPDDVRTDLQVLAELGRRLTGGAGFGSGSAEEVFNELRRASAGGPADYSGISYARLDPEPGVFWPCPGDGHPGTPRMFAERFAHPDGRARLVPVAWRPAAEEPDEQYPLYFHHPAGTASTTTAARRPAASPAWRRHGRPPGCRSTP